MFTEFIEPAKIYEAPTRAPEKFSSFNVLRSDEFLTPPWYKTGHKIESILSEINSEESIPFLEPSLSRL